MTIRSLLVVALLLTLSTVTFGQTSRGTVTGTVTDPNGAVISGAEVTLTSGATKLSRTTTSNAEGLYRFEAVDPGTYSVKVNATGFGEVLKTGIEVRANQTSDVAAQMAPAGQVARVALRRSSVRVSALPVRHLSPARGAWRPAASRWRAPGPRRAHGVGEGALPVPEAGDADE